MTLRIIRPTLLASLLLAMVAVLVPLGAGGAAAAPQSLKREAAPQVVLADWYGTAHAIQISPNSGGYLLTRDAGVRTVILEERSVKVRIIKRAGQKAPVQRATPWHRLAVAPPNGLPAVGQWTRSAGYNGKQFRLCRTGIPGKGKVCTAYSGVIVAL
ncbi:hypothetical protein GOEFS_015_00050 [Gordonia effusa NBRC 100432]|uniref:Uncharacterized protein n=1 Tax=Gordonia effusa NBRC 100432 TaxID=1077974 RepID=H0QVK2_9ACTN|nr:hypothetical protein [Gordonia effusa]GAB16808.1 hypothetical protein GOEFS_015_00050 [Gordonia effusa NBRC 100432]